MRILALLLWLWMGMAHATLYTFADAQQETRYYHLLGELRCLVCPNQDLADSGSPLADDLRHEVHTLIINGKTDTEIVTFLTERYGDFIRFRPPVKPLTWLLWFAPLIFGGCGLMIYARVIAGRSS